MAAGSAQNLDESRPSGAVFLIAIHSLEEEIWDGVTTLLPGIYKLEVDLLMVALDDWQKWYIIFIFQWP